MIADDGWRPIPSCPGYFADTAGRILSRRRGGPRLLTQIANPRSGYLQVGLFLDRRLVTRTVHTLVAEAFYGPRPPGLVVRHLDGDELNVEAANLAYGTTSQNVLDEVRHGTHAQAAKTHCPQGHPYDAVNTHMAKSGGRRCRRCNADRAARRYALVRTGGTT